jgi:hypothetical protein
MTDLSVGEMLRAKYKSEDLTATNATWITAGAGNRIVVLSVSWVIEAGSATPSVRFTGATNYPGGNGAFETTLGDPHHHQCEAGLFESAVAGSIGVTIAGTGPPSVPVSITYVEVGANYVA